MTYNTTQIENKKQFKNPLNYVLNIVGLHVHEFTKWKTIKTYEVEGQYVFGGGNHLSVNHIQGRTCTICGKQQIEKKQIKIH